MFFLILALSTSAVITIFSSVTAQGVYTKETNSFIGTTTTDMFGNYGIVLEPDITERYQIIATFEGSKGTMNPHA